MIQGINFVYQRRKKLTQSQEKDRQFFKYSLVGLGAVFALLLIAIGIRVFLIFSINRIIADQEIARKAILSQQQVERDYIVFANKLQQLSILFDKRKNKQDALIFFSDVFGNSAIVSGIDYSAADNDILSFTLQMQDVFYLDEVFEILSGQSVTEVYPSIEKSGLRRGEDGVYRLNLTVNLAGGEIPEEIKLEAPSNQIDSELAE